jgi:hypothetical protein
MLLESAAESALFDGRVQGLVVACYENERPLRGLAGILDWRFEGFLSRCIREGVFSGRPGECVYLPLRRAGRAYHLILAGAGHVPRDRDRGDLPDATVKALSRNLASLKLARLGVSRSDLGGVEEKALRARLPVVEGGELWIAP